MAANTSPIFSREGNITRAARLTTAANDYTGVSIFNKEVFEADPTNGSYVSRIRFKALGTNVQTVARIYLNNGKSNETWGTTPAAPTATPSTTGGTLLAGTYYAQIIAINAFDQQTVLGTLSAGVTTTGSTGSIPWTWTAIPGAVSYRIYVGINNATGNNSYYFTSVTNSYTQTTSYVAGIFDDPLIGNSKFYGEITLPATTISANAATPDIDYPMNIAIPPGWAVYVGLGTTVAAGWSVVAIGGDY
jgi:hypothetical protein